MSKIEDGTGTGTLVAVSATNRLLVSAETVTSLSVASLTRADAFTISTGQEVALTAGTSAIILVENESSIPFAVGSISASTDTSCVVVLYRNPGLAGTIVSSGTAISPVQLNFGSSKSFTGNAYLGADGLTVGTTSEVVAIGRIQPGFTSLPLAGAVILNTSDTIGVAIIATGATNVAVNLITGFIA